MRRKWSVVANNIFFKEKFEKLNPGKNASSISAEVIGAGIMLAFLIFTVFAASFWGS